MPYKTSLPDGEEVVVPGIVQGICGNCDELFLSITEKRKIEEYISAEVERIDPSDLRQIRERLKVDQSEMGQILGLGVKTYHRWERGSQIPSRSMGFYIRVLNHFPEAFQWLRARGWKSRENDNIIYIDFTSFNYINEADRVHIAKKYPNNPAMALLGVEV